MSKIIEYNIVEEDLDSGTLYDMQYKVQKMLNEGWQPLGGIAISECHDQHSWRARRAVQAMVKYKTEVKIGEF